jgi:cysteine-rich repeat protein
MRISHELAIVVCGLAGVISDVAADQTDSDAPITTSADGSRVDDNRYAEKADVYLAGTTELAAGDYYFAVTDASGAQILSSDALSCREIRISDDGVIVELDRDASGCVHVRGVAHDRAAVGAITVQLMPFDDTPSQDGQYVVRIIPVTDYAAGFMHTGAKHADFKVESPARCGNDIVEPGEQCDDGNAADGDGCSASCRIETPSPVCGNGIVETGEQCDDGNTANDDGCSSICLLEALLPDCGDDFIDIGEQCDDGNTLSGDGCSAACRLEAPGERRESTTRSSEKLAT